MRTYQIDVKVFELLTSDSGGMSDVHVAYFAHESDAKELCKANNWFRVRGKKLTHVYHVCESVNEFTKLKEMEKRDKILAKLTDEELEFLGIQR